MKTFRWIMIILAVPYAVFAGLTAMVGLFADGGTIWERVLLCGVHPLGAVALLSLVWQPVVRFDPRTGLALGVILISILGDGAVFAAITSEVIRGDAALAVIFALIPLAGIVYAVASLFADDHISNAQHAG